MSGTVFFATVALASCVDDNDDKGMPYLEVTPDVLTFNADGAPEGASAFTVKSNRPWTLEVLEGSDWVTPSATQGSGDGTVEFTIPASNVGRIAKLSFNLKNAYGAYWTKEVTIEQGEAPKAGEVSALVAYIKNTWPSLESGTEELNYSQKTIPAVILANDAGGNLYQMISVGDNTGDAGTGILIADAAYETVADYPVGARITLTLDATSTVYNSYGLYKINKVTTAVDNSSPVQMVVPSVTLAQFNSNDYMGMNVKVTGLAFKGEAGEMWYSGTANYSTRLFTDGSGDLAVRTYKTVAWGGELISSTVTAGSLIGVAEVYDGAAQLYPQSAADVADFKVDASTPVITEVDPASLTWGAEETVTKNVAVTVVNLGSNALTVDNDAIAPFTAVVNGTTVTVTPPAPNTTSDDIVRTMTVSVAGGNSREVTLTQFAAGSGGDTKGIYTSMSQFIPASTSTTDRYYPSNSTIDGQPATGFKLGTSSLAGVFTSEALGASLTGDKKLSFYAVAWTGKAATVYIRVNNGGAVSGDGSHAITASAGATGSGNDFTFTDVTDSDYYTFQLTGLTAASTVTISTSPDFTAASDRNTGRAIVLGVQVY